MAQTMNNYIIPTISIQPSPAIGPVADTKWKGLVGKNLGPEVQDLYQGNNDLQVFEPAKLMREGLEQAIQSFNDELSRKDKKKALTITNLETFEDLAETIRGAADTWAKRKRLFPGVQDKLIKFLNSASHYQNLIAIFPSQNQYTSSLCAAFKVLVTAATNYQETAEGLTEALVEISIAAKNISDLNALFDTEEMRRHVVTFYTSILRFCVVAISWYQSRKRRILGNFKDNLYSEVRDIITFIKAHAETIKETAAKGSMAETRTIHEKITRQGEYLRYSLDELKNRIWVNHAFTIALLNQQNHKFRRSRTRRIHTRKGRGSSSRSSGGRSSSRFESCSDEELEDEIPSPVARIYPQHEILSIGRKKFALHETDPKVNLRSCMRRMERIPASDKRSFRERLNLWMTESSSSLLWIRGDPCSPKISPITSFAAQLIHSALFAEIKVVFYLCTFHRHESERQPVLALIHSLIIQLVEMEKTGYETVVDLSETRFAKAKSSFDSAWDLLEDIVRIGSARTIFIAIDCLERFDEDENCGLFVQKLESLIEMGSETVVKVLLTSKRNTTNIFDNLPKRVGLRMRTKIRVRNQSSRARRRGPKWQQGGLTASLANTSGSSSSEVDSDESSDEDGSTSEDSDDDLGSDSSG